MASISATPARADLRMCNLTTSRIGIAIGYRDQQGWVTEGWWNIAPRIVNSRSLVHMKERPAHSPPRS